MYDNALVAIASHTMGDNGLFDSNYNPYSPEDPQLPNKPTQRPQTLQKPLLLTNMEFTPQEIDEDGRSSIECDTPQTLVDQEPLSPKHTMRRTSGRRPLSILSNSSLNSNPELCPSLETRTPEHWSPSRHRRHRSVIGGSVDYRQYNSSMYPPYTPNGGRLFPGGLHYSPQNASTFQSQVNPIGSQINSPPLSFNHVMSNNSTPLASPPLVQRGIPGLEPLESPSSLAPQPGLQDFFEELAFKERQVLEARETLQSAQEELKHFKRHLQAMLASDVMPTPIRPTMISRKLPLGINALQLFRLASEIDTNQIPTISSWCIDVDVDDTSIDEVEVPNANDQQASHDGIALQIIKCLLGIVRCVISTFPVEQQNLTLQQDREQVVWRPQYPLPMDSMYGHFFYEA